LNKFSNLNIYTEEDKGGTLKSTFNAHWDAQDAWQREFSFLLRLFSRWLKDNALMDAAVQDRLKCLESRAQLSGAKLIFVAEFPRDTSEILDALVFADCGRAIMPTSAGRALCPMEISSRPGLAPSLRLLPIWTKLQPQTLSDLRHTSEAWTHFDLDVNDPAQIARTFAQLTESLQVTQQEAQALGLGCQQTSEPSPPTDDSALVQVPKWRHASVNFLHPLLDEGVVILDMSHRHGAQADPEIIASLIEQAEGFVFILSADTGAIGWDLALNQKPVHSHIHHGRSKLVVLSNVAPFGDELRSIPNAQIQVQLQRLCADTALEVDSVNSLVVSDPMGLVDKAGGNADLPTRGSFPIFDAALAQGMAGGCRAAMCKAIAKDISKLHTEVGRMISARQIGVADQRAGLEALRASSDAVLHPMRQRIAHELQEFERGICKVRAFKAVNARLFLVVQDALDPLHLPEAMQLLSQALSQPGLKRGVNKAYAETFLRLRQTLHQALDAVQEIREMQVATFHQITAELGAELQLPAPPALEVGLLDLELIERSHQSYLGIGNLWRLQQPKFTQRLVASLASELAALQTATQKDAELWRDAVVEHLDRQVEIRRSHFANRREAIAKIGDVAHGLDQRQLHLADQQKTMAALVTKLNEKAAQLAAANEDHHANG
jgi:hypothetical protein